VLDLRHISDATDFFVIASGTSDTHVRTLAESVLEAIEEHAGRAHHVEGVSAGRWALLDFVDVVVHVFHPTLRAYYQLERLWADAPVLTAEALGEPAAGDDAPAPRRRGGGSAQPHRRG
jgi:ribosome-associated protein